MEIEWLILADGAEVINNKLYLIGGGWESLTINAAFPRQHVFALVAAFKVPWAEANRQHTVELTIEDESGHGLATIAGQIEVELPAGVPLAQAQRVQMAVTLALTLTRPGPHAAIARVDGREGRRTHFHVVPGPEAVTPIL
jgi:hypothetical protein